MADTQRTKAQLIALLADNVTGQISAQDLRDFLVTVMETEFTNPGDFWKEADAQYLLAEGIKGWIDYSQLISEACSFGNVLERGPSGQWTLWSAVIGSNSDRPVTLGVAGADYAISTFGNVLRKGLVYHSAFSASFADNRVGWPVYLYSGSPGSITTASQESACVVGFVEPEQSTGLENDTNLWRFDPSYGWGIVA